MPYLVAAVALTGALGLLNLLLLLAVIRRLREMTARDAKRHPKPREELLRGVGAQIDAFTAIDMNGDRIASDTLADRLLVGFFAPGCAPCHEQLPVFRRLAESRLAQNGDRDGALAVVVGALGDKADGIRDELSSCARVTVESVGGPLTTAFGVSGFPTFYVIDRDRMVRAAELNVAMIGAELPAASGAAPGPA